jgi:septal ring factor EnvC (AmiA/AmiB activator)
MILRALVLALVLSAPAHAATVAEQATQAAESLQDAISALEAAKGARDRVTALTTTIRAYESGLAALRASLREVQLRERQLTLRYETESARVQQLLGVLAQVDTDPGPLLLLHPDGPLGTARSGMILADVAPALQAEVEKMRTDLTELRDLRDLRTASSDTLAKGLAAAQDARTALSQAISDRTDLPIRFEDDPARLDELRASAETLGAFAAGLAPDIEAPADFDTRKGALPLPVQGRLIRAAGEADAAGVRHPGLSLATRPLALVTAPAAATIRYRGPLLDYGNVMILEPGAGYLLIFAGLGAVYGEVGEVVPAGAALGLMGGAEPGPEFLTTPAQGAAQDSETIYIELRRGTEPEDPAPWFADLEDGRE